MLPCFLLSRVPGSSNGRNRGSITLLPASSARICIAFEDSQADIVSEIKRTRPVFLVCWSPFLFGMLLSSNGHKVTIAKDSKMNCQGLYSLQSRLKVDVATCELFRH